MNKQSIINEERKLALLKSIFETVLNEPESMANGYEFRSPQLQITRNVANQVKTADQAVDLLKKFIADNQGEYGTVRVSIFHGRDATPEEAYEEIKRLYADNLEYQLVNISTNVSYNEWKKLFAVSVQMEPTSQGYGQAVRDMMRKK
jgi:hypothetical protein